MPALSNGRHELYAQELAAGATSDAAYEAAGYKPNRGNAARLKADESVSARVAELQQAAALQTGVTVMNLTQELLTILGRAKLGETAGHLSAARQSVMDIAKLNGLVVDTKLVGNKDDKPFETVIRWAKPGEEVRQDPSEEHTDEKS